MEGFAPYTNNSFTNARRRPFEGDKSMFGSSQTGRHLEMRGLKVLYQRHKRIFPYGYPYAYVPNIHNQYILILQNAKKQD